MTISIKSKLLTLPLGPWEAALGKEITLLTLSGKIQLAIPVNSLKLKVIIYMAFVVSGVLFAIMDKVAGDTKKYE